MSLHDDTQAAIRGFYEAATGQSRWEAAFDRLLAATGFVGAAFYVVDRATQTPLDSRWHNLDESYAVPYLRDYVGMDPRAAQVFVPDPVRVLYDSLHTAEAEMDRDPFYVWFQRSQHHRYYVGGQSRQGAALPLTLTLHRPAGRGHVEPAEAAVFGHLFDHFEHAVKLQHGLALDAARASAALADQEAEAHGVVLLDRRLRLLHANAAAIRVAARGDALGLGAGGLAGTQGHAAAVAALLAAAAKGCVTEPIQLDRAYGGLPYVLHAWPLAAPDLLAGAGSVAVAVRILDPDAAPATGLARAAQLLGFTRQEAMVVAQLVEGADPTEIAALLGLRPATVRTYLAAVYRKTGCHRQGALVARVMAVAAGTEGPQPGLAPMRRTHQPPG